MFQQVGELFKIAQTYPSSVSYCFPTMDKLNSPMTVEEVIENWQRQADSPKVNRGRRASDRITQSESLPTPVDRTRVDQSDYDS